MKPVQVISQQNERLLLAQGKVQGFQKKYGTTLAQFEALGVPENASYEAHEDYILWQHWATEVRRAKEELQSAEPGAGQTGSSEKGL
jgi:hypothetical protein